MLNKRSRWSDGAAQVLALFVGVLGLLALVAYIYGLPGSSGLAVYTRMALHTSVTFVLLSVGVVCLQPDVGIVAVIRGEGLGGFMARRLMLAAVAVPIVLGWIVARGEMIGLYGPQFGDVIDATAYAAIFVFLVWTIGRSVNKLDAERKKAEREIRLLAQTVSCVRDCVSITDLEDNIIFVNDAFVQTYGYSREELLGQPVSIVRSPTTSPETTSQILATTLGGGWYGEIINRRKHGSDFPIELWTSVVKDESGRAIANVGVARDITDRRIAEQERDSLINELKTSLENVRTLGGLVPICSHCKKIRDDKGYWNQLEKYIVEHTDAKLTHGLCPDCAKLYFPGVA